MTQIHIARVVIVDREGTNLGEVEVKRMEGQAGYEVLTRRCQQQPYPAYIESIDHNGNSEVTFSNSRYKQWQSEQQEAAK